LLDAKPQPEKPVHTDAPEVEDSTLEPEPEVVTPPVSTVLATPPTPQVTAPVVRKRGTTGLKPGTSSVVDVPEDGKKSGELSEAEAKRLPFDQLKRIVKTDRAKNVARR